jgi:acyl carrier protein phosphodiesterase
MNYLGHAYLSFGNTHLLTGNMIGDFVKGKLALEQFPEGIGKGILLHRKIDSFADTHPANQRAKIWFRQDYGLYSGAIIDTVYDHFLANDPKHFASEKKLLEFSLDTYAKLETTQSYFPPMFAQMFPHMREHNWLWGYHTLIGVQRSLGGLSRRAQHMPPPDKAYSTFISHFYELNQCYYEFMDDVVKFVKLELSH